MNTTRRRPGWISTHQYNRLRLLAWEYDAGRLSEWPEGIEGLVITEQTDKRGVSYIEATLRGCVTANGFTRDQALHNLDVAVRNYHDRLTRVPLSQNNRAQLAVMRRYLEQREEACPCPCDVHPCQCVLDDPAEIAH